MFPGLFICPYTLPGSRRAFLRLQDKNAIHGRHGRGSYILRPELYREKPGMPV